MSHWPSGIICLFSKVGGEKIAKLFFEVWNEFSQQNMFKQLSSRRKISLKIYKNLRKPLMVTDH